MATKCDIAKADAENIIDNQEHKEEYLDKNSKVNKVLDEGKELQEILDNEYSKGQFVDESIINEKINKLYGKNSERKKIAIKIRALMDANESLAEYILQFAIEHIGENQKVGTAVSKDENGNLVQVDRYIELSRFPISSLKAIYKEALKPSFSTEGVGLTNFNGIFTNLITPKQRGAKEPSGAFWIIQRAVNGYANRVSHRIDRFTSKLKDKNEKTVWKGMNNVYESIQNLVSYHPQSSDPDLDIKYTSFFSRFMEGRIFQNDNGEWMIYADYGPITNERNFVQFYEKSNDVKHGWQNAVLLKDFTPQNKKKGDYYIEMPAKARKKFFELVNEARKIDNASFEYFQKAMQGSLDNIADELHQAFPNLKRQEVFQIMFRNKTETSKNLSKIILSKLTEEQLELYETLHKAFEPMIQDEFILVTGSKVEKRKNHWPGQFNEDLFKPMLDKLIMELDNTVDSITKLHDNKEDELGNKFDDSELAHLRKTIRVYNSKLNYAKVLSKKLDGYPTDVVHNQVLALVNDNKFFKRISNAYDRGQARTDEGVYFDYLRNMSGTVERNILVSKLIKSIVTSKNKNSDRMHKVVSRSAINLFKVPFHGTDIFRTGFLNRILPTPNTVEGINNMLNYIPGRNKTALQLAKTYRFISSYLSGTYLAGLGTTVQNMTDTLRNIIYSSFSEFQAARRDLVDPTKRKNIERIIQASGITEFSDFFSKSMVNGIIDRQLENAIANRVLKAMMDWANSNQKSPKSWSKNTEKFLETVTELLEKSNSILKPEDFLKFGLTKEQIKRRRKQIGQEKRLMFANKLVQFAIEKEFVFADAIKQRPWSPFIKKSASVAVEGYIATTTLFNVGNKALTMSATERWIRSVSFVIGLNRAQRAGLMNQDIPWYKFTDTKDINEAIKIGRGYQERVNFGLSTQAVGEYFYNGWGMLQGKFKYWSNQKFGADVRLWKEAYASMESMKNIESNAFDFKAIGKMFYTMARHRGKTLRTTNPEIAALKKFMITQLPLTVAFDVFTLLTIPGLRIVKSAMYYGSGSKGLRGFTSDLVSLSISVPMIIGVILSGNADDEEDREKMIKYYMRKGFFGFLPMWKFDSIVALAQIIGSSSKRGFDNLIDASNVFRGGNMPWNKAINPIAKELIDD